jgi:hypothetical protein
MLELRQLDLQLAFPGAGTLREDIEDQRRPIEHLALKYALEVPALSGRQLVVEDDGVHLVLAAFGSELIGFPAPDKSACQRRFQLLCAIAYNFASGGGSQFFELAQGILEVPSRARLEIQTNEEDSFRGSAGCLDQGFQLLSVADNHTTVRRAEEQIIFSEKQEVDRER